MTLEEAVKLAESKFYEKMTYREIAKFQINTPLLCMPFRVFHEAMEKALNRPVWTHEFGLNWNGLKDELNGGKTPSCQEIFEMIPEEKRIIIVLE